MKTMSIWNFAFGLWPNHVTIKKTMQASLLISVLTMFAAFSLISCSSDNEELQTDRLAGLWLQVYDERVASDGYTQYTFTPGVLSVSGHCEIKSHDVFAGETTYQRGYILDEENRRLSIFEEIDGEMEGKPEYVYDVWKLSDKGMTLHLVGSDVVLNFKKVK